MIQSNPDPGEETLDPQDWEAMRHLGHRIVDDMIDYLRTSRERPVWQPAPELIQAHFTAGPPLYPQPPEAVYAEYRQYVLPHLLGNTHPRFWGWVLGNGTVMGAYADFLANATNAISGAFSFVSSNYVELQVLDWCKTLFGFPASASGQFTGGCSASNLIALAVARNAQAGFEVRREGLGAAPRMMTLYASAEAHSSIQKAVELLGLGSEALRKVPVNEQLQIEVAALRAAIQSDRQRGYQPFCVVGAAGTTNTGAIDDLHALADICRDEGLWFHVDGAFGAWAAIAPASKPLVAGMERADSLAFDLHKWMYLPYDIACVLVRHEAAHRHTFSMMPTYLSHGEGTQGLTAVDVPWLTDYGFDLSRSFPALKAWMTIKEQGLLKYGRLIQQNIDQAHELGRWVEAAPELELALPVSLNVVCFRYVQPNLDDDTLDALNKQIELDLQEQGRAVVSMVVIRGRKYLHAAITNHRTRREDLAILVSEVIRAGNRLTTAGP
jgi:glutamate/tyrosine decarboxylase-like PLP-dependent enzyme